MKDDVIKGKFEDFVLAACLKYKEFLAVCSNWLEPSNFSSPTKGLLFEVISNYFQEQNAIPTKELILFELSKPTIKPEVRDYIQQYMEVQLPFDDLPTVDYLKNKLHIFIRGIKLKRNIMEALELLEQGQIDIAEETVAKSLHEGLFSSESFDEVLDYSVEDIRNIVKKFEQDYCFETLITPLDDAIGGVARKELFVIIAPTNVGKSWMSVHLAVAALIQGQKVMLITLELSRRNYLRRIFMNITGATKDIAEDYTYLDLWDRDFEDKVPAKVPTLKNVERIQRRLKFIRKTRSSLIIKDYPAGTYRIKDLKRDLLLYEAQHQRLPDVIIIDGLGGMRASNMHEQEYKRLGQLAIDLRAISFENDLSIILTHQANREAVGKRHVGVNRTAGSFEIAQVADVVVSLAQTEDDQFAQVCYLQTIKAREGTKPRIKLYQDYRIGQFCLRSELVRGS